MSLHKQLFKGGLQLGATQLVSQGCAFLRNWIVARVLSPADFGIAATFAITIALLEMLGSLSAEKLLVQAEDGDEKEFQAAAHFILIGRGIFSGLLVFLCAGPVARLFGVPGATWAFRWLAVVPLIKSLVHLDMHRIQRRMNFGAVARADMVANLLGAAAAWPLTAWLRDYSAMLWLMVAQALLATAMSHVLAERRYGLSWNRGYATRMVTFGWPLMLNSLLMFGIFQGDRFIIGSASRIFHKALYSLGDLGTYSVAFSLTLSPTLLVAGMSSSLLLPVLARVQKRPLEFARRYAMSAQVLTLVSGCFAISMVAAGGWLVLVMYGHKYSAAGQVIGWLGAMQGIRMLRVAPTLAAMAYGDTQNVLIANLFRTVALLGSLAIASQGGSLARMAASGFAGEIAALTVSLIRLRRICSLSPMLCLKPALLPTLFVLVVVGFWFAFPGTMTVLAPWLAFLLVVLMIGVMLGVHPLLRDFFRPITSKWIRENPVLAKVAGPPQPASVKEPELASKES